MTNEELALLRETARAFARNEVEPLAQEIDRTEATPQHLIDKVAELGFFGVCVPEEYGGIGGTLEGACTVLEEVAKASPSFAGLLSVQMILTIRSIVALGNEEQKQRVLPAAVSGERPIAWSQTEPAGAGNIDAHLTRLTPSGNGFKLNGAKLFCTQGSAKVVIVMARTKRDDSEGYGAVIVDMDAPGVRVEKYEDKLGWRGTNTGPLSFSDVDVAPEDILGDLITGQAATGWISQAGFIGHSASALGCLEGMFEKTVAYVKDRNLYGEPMYRLSPIIHNIGDIYAKIEVIRDVVYNAARAYDQGLTDKAYGSICKAFVCDTVFQATSTLLQMWGGSGIMNSTGVNRYFRDARAKMVAEGSTEMHTAGLAATVLDLPSLILREA